MPEPTPTQAAIIHHRAGDLVVTAGAGSGKTHVLVQRYLSLLRDHSVPQLAAMTFTESAAAEMRERVRRELIDQPGSAGHLRDLDSALIGTMHAICLRILRDHPVEAALDPAFTVLPEDEAEFELTEACADALEAAAVATGDVAQAILDLGDYAVRTALPSMVADRDAVRRAFAAFAGTTPDHWCVSARATLEAGVAETVASARHVIEAHLDELFGLPCSRPDDRMSIQLLDLRAAYPGSGAPGSTVLSFLAVTTDVPSHRSRFDAVGVGVGSAGNWPGDGLDRAKALIRELRDLAGDLVAACPTWTPDDDRAIHALWRLRLIFEDACERYAARKADRAALDFHDIETRAVALLRGHPTIAAAYATGLRELLVDEFQDTNALQCELIDLLSGRAAGIRDRCRLFIVGDARQAIYGFRGGDVAQFRSFSDALLGAGAVHHSLDRSFRAHHGLVEHVNGLFRHAFASHTPDTPGDAMTGRPAAAPPGPYLTVMTFEPDPAAPKDGANANTRKRYEAHAVAREVRRILDEGRSVWDRNSHDLRPVRPSDIAILLRRFTKVSTFEQALEAHGVAYSTLQGNGFYTRQEVYDLANLLAWLAEPDDQVALFGILRSPMFAIDDATIAAIRAVDRYDLLDCLASPPSALRDEVAARCAAAHETLVELRTLAATAPVDEVIAAALARTGFEAAWAAVRGGEQAVANIRKLSAIARTLAGRSLDEFVEYLLLRAEAETREAQAVLDERDAVRILTVHGAKGLEFPIVFVPEAETVTPLDRDPIRWNRSFGVAATLEKPIGEAARTRTAFNSWLASLQDSADASEYWRLYYVACTRAADYLYISGAHPSPEPSRPTWISVTLDAFSVASIAQPAIRPPEIIDTTALLRRSASPLPIPSEADEIPVAAPLVVRPRVIPIRTSTPVTALREEAGPTFRPAGHGDGLATLRGQLAHRAIELRYGSGVEPDLLAVARQLREAAIPDDALLRVAAEVAELLARFATTPLAATLPIVAPRFEVPFAFDWDGVPVHGALDLVYVSGGDWHIVDFKTDTVRGSLEDTARPYLAQLGLYGLAIERATGIRPHLSLAFLRTGQQHPLAWPDVEAALARVRARVDAGALLDGDAVTAALGEPA